MVIMLRKLRSLWAKPSVSSEAQTPFTHPLTPSAAEPSSGGSKSDISSIRAEMAAIRSRIDALQQRNDAIAKSISDATTIDAELKPLHDGLKSLRSEVDNHADRHAKINSAVQNVESLAYEVRAASDAASDQIERHSQLSVELQDRMERLSRNVEETQMILNSTIDTVNNTRSELINRDALRSREIAGRLVGLYVISCIALTVALATLFLVLVK